MNGPFTRNALFAPLFIGCINLIAILYGFYHLYSRTEKQLPTVHSFMLPNEKKYGNVFSVWEALKEFKRREQVVYVLKGNEEDDKKLAVIRQHALQIKYSCDTNTVIKVHLRSSTTYGEFIRLLDIMRADSHKRYLLYQDDFYIVPPKPNDCLEEEPPT